jgi:hypothetical protein
MKTFHNLNVDENQGIPCANRKYLTSRDILQMRKNTNYFYQETYSKFELDVSKIEL